METQNLSKKNKEKEINGIWVLLFFLLMLIGIIILGKLTL